MVFIGFSYSYTHESQSQNKFIVQEGIQMGNVNGVSGFDLGSGRLKSTNTGKPEQTIILCVDKYDDNDRFLYFKSLGRLNLILQKIGRVDICSIEK